MGAQSKIEWCDHTFNPWIGCQKVSPGCDRCYAEAMMDHRYGKVQWGPHGERKRTSDDNWKLPLRWARQAQSWGRRPRVFCASLADVFDNQVPPAWRMDLFALIECTPELDWLLLTKRPENIRKMVPLFWQQPALRNVWLGTTCEDQQRYDQRWLILRDVPVAVHFISYEPAVGPLSIQQPYPDWIIVGGESGHGARPMHPAWARSVRDQCAAARIPFFFKQHGEWAPIETTHGYDINRDFETRLVSPDGKHIADSDCMSSDFPTTSRFVYRIGKKGAGRLLDGVEHNEFPQVAT